VVSSLIPELTSQGTESLSALGSQHGLDLIVLFGSTAKGRRHESSDLDIAVRFVTQGAALPSLREEATVEGALLDLLKPDREMDLVVLNGAPPLLKWNVAQHGIPLWSVSEAAWIGFRIAANREFEDAAKFRRRRWQELRRRYQP
jgi:predicted nucleotidyltransferase